MLFYIQITYSSKKKMNNPAIHILNEIKEGKVRDGLR